MIRNHEWIKLVVNIPWTQCLQRLIFPICRHNDTGVKLALPYSACWHRSKMETTFKLWPCYWSWTIVTSLDLGPSGHHVRYLRPVVPDLQCCATASFVESRNERIAERLDFRLLNYWCMYASQVPTNGCRHPRRHDRTGLKKTSTETLAGMPGRKTIFIRTSWQNCNLMDYLDLPLLLHVRLMG